MLLQALCSISYPLVNSNWSYSPEMPNLVQIRRFLEPYDLEIWRMTLKNKRAPLLCYFNFVHHFIATGEFKRELQSGNAQSGSNWTNFSRDLKVWRMTLKNNRAPLLSNIKLYVSFHHHIRIQTGVTVRTFDLWPWPFAWSLPWSLVITPENYMMIRWWEHR